MNLTFIEKYKIDNELCNELIRYHKNNVEYKSYGYIVDKNGNSIINKDIKDSIDVVFYNGSKNKITQQYFAYLSKFVDQYIKKYKILSSVVTDEGNNIQYYPPGGGFKVWHYERVHYSYATNARCLAYMTYLNDVKNGGETEFYWQKIKIKPKKGLTLIWPTEFTHLHRGIPTPIEEKYIVTGWFNLL